MLRMYYRLSKPARLICMAGRICWYESRRLIYFCRFQRLWRLLPCDGTDVRGSFFVGTMANFFRITICRLGCYDSNIIYVLQEIELQEICHFASCRQVFTTAYFIFCFVFPKIKWRLKHLRALGIMGGRPF